MKQNPRSYAAFCGLLLSAAFIVGCNKKSTHSDPPVKKVEIAGVVRGVDPENAILTVEHEDVPGFMPSMTMPFTAKNPKEIAGIKTGDAIAFHLLMTQDDSWIEDIKLIQAASLHLPAMAGFARAPSPETRRLKEGDLLPDFHLVDQMNRPLSAKAFGGKTVLLTFIFTRCPVPNFCPLISRNFEHLAKEIKQEAALANRVRLLSISFDPEFDTPEMLARYGKAFSDDAELWRFATGQPAEIEKLTHGFSVYVQAEAGTLNHGLCTVLVDPSGTIKKIWRGNGWRPEEVLAELKALSAHAPESATNLDPDQSAGIASHQD